MNMKKQLAEKRNLEETKSNLKITKLLDKKPIGLRIVKAAELCDPDILEFRDKLKEKEITINNAPLTHRLKLKAA